MTSPTEQAKVASEQIRRTLTRLANRVEGLENSCKKKDRIIERLSTTANWIDPKLLKLRKKSYSAVDIIFAFQLAKTHEGLETNEFNTVLDTFIEKLEEL